MKFCNLVKLMDQYCGEKFQPCRGFQYEVTEASKWPELIHVKGSLAEHAPPLESNFAGALPLVPPDKENNNDYKLHRFIYKYICNYFSN